MITGNKTTGYVHIGGVRLDPHKSVRLRNHSPDGFMWGYAGSGPSQLALALLLEFTDEKFALANYQDFKFDIIAPLPQTNFEIPTRKIKAWCRKRGWHEK